MQNLSNEKCLTNNLRRALLATDVTGEYNFYDYWQSYWYLEGMNKRKLISNYREIEYLLHSDYQEYFRNLVHDLVDSNLEDIIERFLPPTGFHEWKVKLIKDKSLLDSSKSDFIAISEDNSFCYLLKSARPRDLEGSTKVT